MAKLADAHDLGSCAARLGGSSPFIRTKNMAGKTKNTTKKVKTPKAKAEAIDSHSQDAASLPPFKKTPDGTIELQLVLPWKEIETQWKIVTAEMVKNINMPGFRKGKAPEKLAEERLDKAAIRNEIINHMLPGIYGKAIKDNNVTPIMDPQIHIDGVIDDGKDWVFHALTCEAPAVELGKYKEAVAKITAKSKIVVPGKEVEQPKFEDIIEAVLTSTTIKIPAVLIQREADRLIAQTLEEIKKLGMSLDQYLASTGQDIETFKAMYAQRAERDLKLEFVLSKISQAEKISVDDAEIQKTIDGAKPEEKASLAQNKYLLASIIRQQKTLDFLRSL